jgi:hypothetical protein
MLPELAPGQLPLVERLELDLIVLARLSGLCRAALDLLDWSLDQR